MAIHAACYAMFHGVRAVLLKHDGMNAPTKHNAVVNRFGYHAKEAGEPALMAAGRALNDMQEDRLRSDYRPNGRPEPSDAVAAVHAARTFLVTCVDRSGFAAP